MRCFIAVEISSKVLADISRVAELLRKETSLADRDIKWVRPENMHLTLKFLGDVDLNWINSLHTGLKDIVTRHDSFDMTVSNVGSFGTPPRILWAGIDSCHPLMSLQNDIEFFLLTEGFPKEKKQFHPHLTLCRIKNPKAGRAIRTAAKKYAEKVFGITSVSEIIVYESRLTPDGPIYIKIASTKLA